MFTVCEGCLEGACNSCSLYIFATEDGFVFIGCIVFGLVEMGASILGRVDIDIGGNGGVSDL